MLQEKHAYLYYMYITQFNSLLHAMTFLPLKMIPRVTYYWNFNIIKWHFTFQREFHSWEQKRRCGSQCLCSNGAQYTRADCQWTGTCWISVLNFLFLTTKDEMKLTKKRWIDLRSFGPFWTCLIVSLTQLVQEMVYL